ncbi:MAG: hypothetical protein ACO1OB_05485 [Archangium sp.]
MKRLFWALLVLSTVVNAQHAPTAPALTYSGFLEDSGVPVSGPRLIGLSLFAQQSGGSVLCQVPQSQLEVSNGHFQVPLADATCDAAIKSNPEVWVEVRIGSVAMPRTRIGAVPYAVSVAQGVPAGAVMFFTRASCPEGWAPFEALLGRYAVGVDAGVGTQVGTALSFAENRPVGMHSHAVVDPGHQHQYYYPVQRAAVETLANGSNQTPWELPQLRNTNSVMTNIQIADAGTVPGTPAPYVGLLPCTKL